MSGSSESGQVMKSNNGEKKIYEKEKKVKLGILKFFINLTRLMI